MFLFKSSLMILAQPRGESRKKEGEFGGGKRLFLRDQENVTNTEKNEDQEPEIR